MGFKEIFSFAYSGLVRVVRPLWMHQSASSLVATWTFLQKCGQNVKDFIVKYKIFEYVYLFY